MNRDKNGLPLHSDECPDYDGKRCGRMGFRPDRFCEPTLLDEHSSSAREQAFADACKAIRRKYAQAWVDGIGRHLAPGSVSGFEESMFTTGFLRKHVGILYDALCEAQASLATLSCAGKRDTNEYLQDMIDVRGYSASRSSAALVAINAAVKAEFVNHDDES